MNKTIVCLLLSVVIHSLFLWPIHFPSKNSYKIHGEEKIIQASLMIKQSSQVLQKALEKKTQREDIIKTHGNVISVNKAHEKSIEKNIKSVVKEKRLAKTKKLSGKEINQLISIIYQAIQRHKIYPLKSRKLHHQGKVIVTFSLLMTGYVNNVKINKSSGFDDLDKAAIDTVYSSQPFKVSSALKGTQDIAIPITFRLG